MMTHHQLLPNAQKPDEFYRASCGAVLENSGTPEAFQQTCEQWLQAIK